MSRSKIHYLPRLITYNYMNHINKNLEDLITEAFLERRKNSEKFPFSFEYTTSIRTKLVLMVTDSEADLKELHYSFNIDEEHGTTQVYVGDVVES